MPNQTDRLSHLERLEAESIHIHTDVMKTQGLKQALDEHGFDVAFGGARRDEERSRAKERIFSFRTAQHTWDPKNQRPELARLFNARKRKGESIRVFPLSNWTAWGRRSRR
jgi:sulfate adenylyltransferase subunit 2